MQKTDNKGFIGFLVLLILGAGAVCALKDNTGVSYGKRAYDFLHYYVVDRGDEAIEKAKEVQKKMQDHETSLQKMIDETK